MVNQVERNGDGDLQEHEIKGNWRICWGQKIILWVFCARVSRKKNTNTKRKDDSNFYNNYIYNDRKININVNYVHSLQ